MKKKYPYQTINGKKDRIHRHIMEEKLGRSLAKDERVYHMDGDPKNNNLENLILIQFNQSKTS